MSQKLLELSIKEENLRKNQIINEIWTTLEAVSEETADMEPSQFQVIVKTAITDALEGIRVHTNFMNLLTNNPSASSEASFPCKTNKPSIVLAGAIEYLNEFQNNLVDSSKIQDCLIEARNSRTIFPQSNLEFSAISYCDSFKPGTSHPLFFQTSLLLLLGQIKTNASITELLSNNDHHITYDPMINATIQGVHCPVITGQLLVTGSSLWHSGSIVWTPTLGYSYGGSRKDNIYDDKFYKNEDCSSAVAKWIGYNDKEFSTWHLKNYLAKTDSKCADDHDCLKIAEKLVHVNDPQPGSIFLVGSHTGVVTGVYEDGIIETLSYNRDMPQFEGLGYKNISCHEVICSFFEDVSEQNSLLEDL